jgi:hypothetical protein
VLAAGAAAPSRGFCQVPAWMLDQMVRVVGDQTQAGRPRVRSRRQAARRLAGGRSVLASASSMQQHGRSIRRASGPRIALQPTPNQPRRQPAKAGRRGRRFVGLTAPIGCRTLASESRRSSRNAMEVVILSPLVALIAGILILIVPRLLNYIVAIYLILIGLLGLFGHYSA